MVWCDTCKVEVEVEADEAHGFSCCVHCGYVIEGTLPPRPAPAARPRLG